MRIIMITILISMIAFSQGTRRVTYDGKPISKVQFNKLYQLYCEKGDAFDFITLKNQ